MERDGGMERGGRERETEGEADCYGGKSRREGEQGKK